MMARRLEYQSLQAVLLHMEADVRFQISFHMPSIRSVEKMIPLKISSFDMDDDGTNVNDTSFRVGIVRYIPEGNAPWPIRTRLREDGCEYDYDKFGFPVEFGNNILLPGDVSFQREENHVQQRYDTIRYERFYGASLKAQEKALNKLESEGGIVNNCDRQFKCVPEEERQGEGSAAGTALSCRCLQNSIETWKLKLLPFDCRRNNTKHPFTCYIQVTATKGKIKQTQRFEYNKKLFEASKHLHEVLFGDRPMPIRVRDFSLSHDKICRFPIGFRLQIHKARLNCLTVSHKSFPLIMDSSETLNTLEIHGSELQPDAFKGQIVRDARRLVIADPDEHELDILTAIIRDLPNREICILPVGNDFSPQCYIAIMQAWLDGERPVGSSLWMKTPETTASHVLGLMMTRYENSKRTERCITVGLSNSTRLHASFDRFQETSWVLKMSITQV